MLSTCFSHVSCIPDSRFIDDVGCNRFYIFYFEQETDSEYFKYFHNEEFIDRLRMEPTCAKYAPILVDVQNDLNIATLKRKGTRSTFFNMNVSNSFKGSANR